MPAKIIPLISLFMLLVNTVFAQVPQRGDTARLRTMMKDSSFLRNLPPIGKVIGVLKDSASGGYMEFASVALIKMRDSSVAGGALTDEKGGFRIEDVLPGRYFIRISSIGYRRLDSKPFLLTPQEPLKDFGIVWVVPTRTTLKEAEITAEKSEYVNSLDKKVYNVDKTLINAGGSVSDVLQNIPSVTVDIDGQVSLRGSEQVTILIDGKPAGLTGDNRAAILQQLPAATIEQIEVITNPSAKYDAEGMSGIINIKTRKNKNPGVNGSIQVGAGTRDKYNGSIQLNRRSKKSNAYLNYSFRDDRRFNYGNSLRTNIFGDTVTYLRSENDGFNDNLSNNVRAGYDLYINDYNTLGWSGSINQRNESRREFSETFQESEERVFRSGFDRLSKTAEKTSILDGSMDYRRTFPGSKREFTANINLTRNARSDKNNLSTLLAGNRLLQEISREGVFYNGTAQVDYVVPKENYKIESGLKVSIRNNDNQQSSDRYDYDNGTWSEDTLFSDRFLFSEWVYAGYLQWTGRWKIFDLSAGLRAEQTYISGDSKSADTTFTRDFLNLFPSAAIKYSFSEGKELQVSYSRRINRPREQQLNPFRNVSDSINVFVGNPGILPELTNSLELGYIGRYGEQSISATLFYRNTEDVSQRFRTLDTLTNITTQTFLNYATSRNIGAELVIRNSFLKIITTSASFTLFYNTVDATNIESGLTSEIWSGDIRGSVAVKASKQLSFQLTGNYMAPRGQPQGTFRGMSGIDFGFKYDFKGNKWSLNGSLNDIFDTRNFVVTNIGTGFESEFLRKRESRVGSLTLSYRFGKAEQSQRNKRQNRPMEQQNDMMDF